MVAEPSSSSSSMSSCNNNHSNDKTKTPPNNLAFRTVSPTDIPICYDIEQASYPADEAASKSSLQYRQHHAAPYFRCAVLQKNYYVPTNDNNNDDDDQNIEECVAGAGGDGGDDEDVVVGYICSTRCWQFTEEAMSVHDSSGPLLAIHSVVVSQKYRHLGIATAMMEDYIQAIKDMNAGVQTLVLLAKSHLLAFYVSCGFSVIKPSAIVHGKDQWFDCQLHLTDTSSSSSHPTTVNDTDDNDNGNSNDGHPCWIVDAFASTRAAASLSSGNPAAVVLLPAGTDVDKDETIAWMQVVAQEFNLAETAFIWPKQQLDEEEDDESGESGSAAAAAVDDAVNGEASRVKDKREGNICEEDDECDETGRRSSELMSYFIRYFTCNGTQVDLCGHATLASAAVLFQTLSFFKTKLQNTGIVFQANRDELVAVPYLNDCCDGDESKQHTSASSTTKGPLQVKMNFPRKSLVDICASSDRSAVLSMFKSAFQLDDTAENILYLGVDEDGGDLLIELTRDGFLQLGYDDKVNYSALLQWDGYSRGVILCCRELSSPIDSANDSSDDDDDEEHECEEEDAVDFLSRFFAPKVGINEDPVTGSAHCTLAPYFASKLNKTTLVGKQMSKRGGIVTCVVQNDDSVNIIGTAITTMRGSLYI